MSTSKPASLALLYPGDRAARPRGSGEPFRSPFRAFAAAGVRAEPAVWHDDFADEVAANCGACTACSSGATRSKAAAAATGSTRCCARWHAGVLRQRASRGHPAPGHQGRAGRDPRPAIRQRRAPASTASNSSPRSCPPDCGAARACSSSIAGTAASASGVSRRRPTSAAAAESVARPAWQRRGAHGPAGLLQRMAPYFEPAQGGHMIDQAWQPRLADGMVRAYLVEDRVTGFGHQAVNALCPARGGEPARSRVRACTTGRLARVPAAEALLESSGLSCCASASASRASSCRCCGTATSCSASRRPTGAERFVLCEINVSSVSPFPPSSIAPLVEAVRRRVPGRA